MDNQDGPWSVSVAETPYDARSYSLYIKSRWFTSFLVTPQISPGDRRACIHVLISSLAPTHNLTLTRTAMEIVELDLKLRQAYTNLKFPLLPITPATLPQPPPKRKSTFLNTLSRLASPTSARSQRQSSGGQRNNNHNVSQPLTAVSTPTVESNDPFSSFSNGDLPDTTITAATAATAPSTLSTSIAAYLTTLSNILVLRQDRYWKRFVRVRTDDLESVRVERAIKRVRSDLAAHSRGLSKENALDGRSAEQSESGSIHQPEEQSHEERKPHQHQVNHMAVPDTPAPLEEKEIHDPLKEDEPCTSDMADSTDEMLSSGSVLEARDVPSPSGHTDGITKQVEAAPPPTSNSADLPPQQPRMQRSQSADPHKFFRVPRSYTSSVPSENGTESQTGDDSSSSKNGQSRRPRKKRSASTVAIPKEPRKSQRKVVIDDFEMMRVLGKGCAGKVLLVRHKQTSDLFALKAITKRHVLAHQELQHTLTEQAVLKRMAAESRDPFVVKLWWSFHDKENLFLVMVCSFF